MPGPPHLRRRSVLGKVTMTRSTLRRLRLSTQHLPPHVPSVQFWPVRACMLRRMSQHNIRWLQVAAVYLCQLCFGLAGREWYAGVEESGTIVHSIMPNTYHNQHAVLACLLSHHHHALYHAYNVIANMKLWHAYYRTSPSCNWSCLLLPSPTCTFACLRTLSVIVIARVPEFFYSWTRSLFVKCTCLCV